MHRGALGKTRLGQELAGAALAGGSAVDWVVTLDVARSYVREPVA